MRRINTTLITLFIALIAVPATAQDAPPERATSQPTSPRAPRGDQPGRQRAGVPDSVQVVSDVVYAHAPGPDGGSIDLTLDAAFPKQSQGKPLPVVVYIHGGGYRSGSKAAGLPLIIPFAQGGYFAATIDYRLSGVAPFPAAVHDCKAAIRFLRAHAEELGIDPNRIGVWGHSAGGHLSALLGTSGNDHALDGDLEPTGVSSAVQCVVDVSGPVDFGRFGANGAGGMLRPWLGDDPDTFARNAAAATPVAYIDAHDPPVLIVHGTADQLVPIKHAQLLHEALQEVGAPVEYLPVEGDGHGIRQPQAYHSIAAFFDAHLGGQAAVTLSEQVDKWLGRRGARDDDKAPSRRRRQRPTKPPTTVPDTDE